MSTDESPLDELGLPTDPEEALQQAVAPDEDTDEVVKVIVYCDACGEATNRFEPGQQGRAAEAARAHVSVAEQYGEPCSEADTRIMRVYADGRREGVKR